MDAYGHVNNVQYLRYMEEARIALIHEMSDGSGPSMLDEGVVVVRQEIDYRKPLVYRPEPIPIVCWVDAISNSSFTVAYDVTDDDGTVYANGSARLVLVDLESGRPRRVGPEDRARLERLLDDRLP